MRLAGFFFVALPLLAILALAACESGEHTATTKTSYAPPQNPGGRLCTLQCSEANNYCHETCDLQQRKCVSGIQAQAVQDYENYTRAQFASHQAIELRPRDFERTNSCDDAKASCNASCENDFQGCYTRCGGIVTKTSSCQSMCF